MKRIITGMMLVGVMTSAQADFMSEARKMSDKFLGTEISDKIFGKKESTIKLPAIPKVDKKATSTKSYDMKRDESSLKKEDAQKYNVAFLEELYDVVRRKEINDNDLAKWMNVMEQNAGREGVYRALVLDETYRGLENFGSGVNEQTGDFVVNYFAEFLDRSVEKETILRSNIYMLKRVVVENTLEINDALIFNDKEKFYDWYAVFSAEIGKRYGTRFSNKLRKLDSAERHRAWAKSVPTQYVKSEIILKLHILMNSFNGS